MDICICVFMYVYLYVCMYACIYTKLLYTTSISLNRTCFAPYLPLNHYHRLAGRDLLEISLPLSIKLSVMLKTLRMYISIIKNIIKFLYCQLYH